MRFNKFAKVIVIFAGLALTLGLNPGGAWARERHEEKFEKTESLDKDGKVMLTNVSGKIEVKSWDQAQVKIDAVKISEASSLEKAKENAAKVNIEVSKSGNILKIETKYPEHSHDLNVSVNYKLWIPDKASIKIRSVSGGVDAEGIGGTFEGHVVSGGVKLARVGKGVDCDTVSGRISVQDVTGDTNLKTVSGSIEATRIKGSVEAETTSGSVELWDISEAKTVRAKVLSGGITYDGQVSAGGKYTLETLSGSVELVIPANSAFELDADTFSGHIQTDFPITMSGIISPRELRGVVNNGGASVRLKTFSGSIHIRKK